GVTYEVPNAFKNGVARGFFEHWGLDGRFSAHTGFPVSLLGNTLTDPATGQSYSGGLDLVAGQPIYINVPSVAGGVQVNPAALARPVGSQVGTAPRNFVRGFGATQLDATLRKDFPIFE